MPGHYGNGYAVTVRKRTHAAVNESETDVDDARERRRARERALNASPLNYSAVHTHGNRRTVKSMNPAMEFAPRRAKYSSRRRESAPSCFFLPSSAFPSVSAVANHPGGENRGSFEDSAAERLGRISRVQELGIAGIRNFIRAS